MFYGQSLSGELKHELQSALRKRKHAEEERRRREEEAQLKLQKLDDEEAAITALHHVTS